MEKIPKWYEKYYELLQKCKEMTKKKLDCPANVSSSEII